MGNECKLYYTQKVAWRQMAETQSLEDIIKAGDSLVDASAIKSHYLSIISALQKQIFKTRASVRDFRNFHNLPESTSEEKATINNVWIDPVVNNEILQLKKTLAEKTQLLQGQNEESQAQQFNPQSDMGQKLIEKCRALRMENKELGRIVLEGHSQTLNFDLFKEREKNKILEKQLRIINRLNTELDNDNENMAKQLSTSAQEILQLKREKEYLSRKVERLRSDTKNRKRSPTPRKSSPSPKRRDRRSHSRHHEKKSRKDPERRSSYRRSKTRSRSRSKSKSKPHKSKR